VSITTPRGRKFQGIKVYLSDEDLKAGQGIGSGTVIHRFDQPTTVSLGMGVPSDPASVKIIVVSPRPAISTSGCAVTRAELPLPVGGLYGLLIMDKIKGSLYEHTERK